MTTKVTVEVSAGAGHDVAVLTEDHMFGEEYKVTGCDIIGPGTKRDYYATSSRRIQVRELHKK